MNIHHFGIEVSSLDRSIPFYQSFLGLQACENITFLGEELVFLIGKGVKIELIKGENLAAPVTHIAFQVENLENKMTELTMKGFHAIEGPFTLKNGWKTIFYEGPDGEIIEFLEV